MKTLQEEPDVHNYVYQNTELKNGCQGKTIVDNRSINNGQIQLRKAIDHQVNALPPFIKRRDGLPPQLQSGIENLSGYAMDDVKVHYNSPKPAQLQAHAYAQGTDIHLGPGQEKHLPHEAWHVVQQKQGRVRPTRQFRKGIQINDDAGLEREADVMGEKALLFQHSNNVTRDKSFASDEQNIAKSHFIAVSQPIQKFASVRPEEVMTQEGSTCGFYTIALALRALGIIDTGEKVCKAYTAEGSNWTREGEIFSVDKMITIINSYGYRVAGEGVKAPLKAERADFKDEDEMISILKTYQDDSERALLIGYSKSENLFKRNKKEAQLRYLHTLLDDHQTFMDSLRRIHKDNRKLIESYNGFTAYLKTVQFLKHYVEFYLHNIKKERDQIELNDFTTQDAHWGMVNHVDFETGLVMVTDTSSNRLETVVGKNIKYDTMTKIAERAILTDNGALSTLSLSELFQANDQVDGDFDWKNYFEQGIKGEKLKLERVITELTSDEKSEKLLNDQKLITEEISKLQMKIIESEEYEKEIKLKGSFVLVQRTAFGDRLKAEDKIR